MVKQDDEIHGKELWLKPLLQMSLFNILHLLAGAINLDMIKLKAQLKLKI